MATICGIGTAVPPFELTQESAKASATRHFAAGRGRAERYLEVFDNAAVERRFTVAPPETLLELQSFGAANDLYLEWAENLCADAIGRCLDEAGLDAEDVDHIVFVSSSGIATPSVDARLANRLGLASGVRRTPVFGLGCAGGAAGLSLAATLAAEDRTVLLVDVEINSITFQRDDVSVGNLVASALFGDGAAAVLVQGGEDPTRGPRILASKSELWPGTIGKMGWRFVDSGFRVVFSRDIPELIRGNMARLTDLLLENARGADEPRVHYLLHPGGAKILAAYQEVLGVSEEELSYSASVLRDFGNMSSATVLFVLERFLRAGRVTPGDLAVCAAFGPGFSAELVLLGW